MDDTPDPATQFFPGVPPEEIDLYAALRLEKSATVADIKQSYRKLALLCHPDKHVNSSKEAQDEAHLKFQQIGFAYAVLSDEKKRVRYDQTGRTDEGAGLEPGEGGWEAYFEDLFDKVTRGKLDEMKREYQGSQEEVEDLKKAYVDHEGSIDGILSEMPHSNHEDETRFIDILKPFIKSKDLPKFPAWEADVKDAKGRERRKKEGQREAKEAEEHAKAIGVWDEFYGSGKEGPRKKGKSKASAQNEDGVDESALQAMILKRQEKRGAIFDSLLAKYGTADEEERSSKHKKGSKRKAKEEESEEEVEDVPSPKKKAKSARSSGKAGSRKRATRAR